MIPSGKRLHNYGKSPFSMGKSTISMAMFNSYVSHYQRVNCPLKISIFSAWGCVLHGSPAGRGLLGRAGGAQPGPSAPKPGAKPSAKRQGGELIIGTWEPW